LIAVTVFLFGKQILAIDGDAVEFVTLVCARGQKIAAVTKLSLKLAQNEQKPGKLRKLKIGLSDDWQRDLVGFCVR
jgi:hypothetical protein